MSQISKLRTDFADLATHLLVPIVLPDPVLEHFDFALRDFDGLFR